MTIMAEIAQDLANNPHEWDVLKHSNAHFTFKHNKIDISLDVNFNCISKNKRNKDYYTDKIIISGSKKPDISLNGEICQVDDYGRREKYDDYSKLKQALIYKIEQTGSLYTQLSSYDKKL